MASERGSRPAITIVRHAQALLALRPTNVVSRLGKASPVCILNPRDVFRALASRPVIVPHVSAHVPCALPGILRAARDTDSVLSVGGAAAQRASGHEVQVPPPHAQFAAVAEAASAVADCRPLMLVGHLPVDAADAKTAAAMREFAFKFVDAGFTAVSVRPGNEPTDAIATLAAEMSGPTRERELALELCLLAAPDAARLAALSQALQSKGVPVDVVCVPVNPGMQPHALEKLARAVRPSLLAGAGAIDRKRCATLATAGLRRIDLTRDFFDVAAPSLPAEEVAELRAVTDLGLALAARAAKLTAAMPEDRRERVEALAYAEMLELVRVHGAQGSASVVGEFLSKHSGY